ncbi:Aste57867_24900 [Aphanomyces stellatus]|uniref:Aste57867_24900 protein n=1 Tax=Aphanomyces stellatus TaxID=120398 RepID=A0A485LRP5_9STRA|nr:hypothetical protein As57867_024822 [Aphanomyces stellatus]VFU01534.1 Aste57867_24900 [Aphanomyces stellatus]
MKVLPTALAASVLLAAHIDAAFRNVVYYTEWSSGSSFDMKSIDWVHVTHINYAFGVPQSDGSIVFNDPAASLTQPRTGVTGQLQGNLGEAFTLKQQFRTTKVGLSIGGYGNSAAFPAIAASASLRASFVAHVVRFVQDLGLDHIDLDWEYPGSGDMANFVLLLQELKAAMSALPFPTELTVAGPGNDVTWRSHVGDLCRVVDGVNLMTYRYDFMGEWNTVSGFQSNLFTDSAAPLEAQNSVDHIVQYYLHGGGCPAEKLVVGVPLYGRLFNNTDGKYLGFSGATTVLYKSLAAGSDQFDGTSQSAYAYVNREFISYDNPQSVQAKAAYVQQYNLGGMMFWEASGDGQGPRALIPTLVRQLGQSNVGGGLNNLVYPTSKYNNVAVVPLTLLTHYQLMLTQSKNGQFQTVAAGDATSLFYYNPTSQLLTTNTGDCVDAYPNATSTSQYSVHPWACAASNGNQKWLLDLSDHHIRHATHADICLDVDGSTVQVWWCHDHNINMNQWIGLPREIVHLTTFNGLHLQAQGSQVFFDQSASGSWTVDYLHQTVQWATSGLCLDAYQAWDGGAVHLWPCDSANANQQWTYDPATHQLRHRRHVGFCLDMASDTGSHPHLWSCHVTTDSYFRYQRFGYVFVDPAYMLASSS